MGRVIGAMLLTMFLSVADTALAESAGGDDSVGPKACGALQQETVPQSLRSAEFIVAHIEFIPPQEQAYMEKESSADNLGPDIGRRYECVTRRPSYPAWRLQISLRDLIKALKSIDEMSPGENVPFTWLSAQAWSRRRQRRCWRRSKKRCWHRFTRKARRSSRCQVC